MTVIVAKVMRNTIQFAADRATTLGWRRMSEKERQVVKLHQVNGMTIGGCGLAAHSQWLVNFAQNHAPTSDTEVSVSAFMLECRDHMKAKDSAFTSQNHFLIGFGGCLFRFFDELSIFKVPSFAAIGSGSDYAIAALYLGKTPKQAAEVAAALDLHCGDGVDVVNHKCR